MALYYYTSLIMYVSTVVRWFHNHRLTHEGHIGKTDMKATAEKQTWRPQQRKQQACPKIKILGSEINLNIPKCTLNIQPSGKISQVPSYITVKIVYTLEEPVKSNITNERTIHVPCNKNLLMSRDTSDQWETKK